ncbi:hypothetical protein Daus18300_005744 [Diaporthe australafricana]|uniref:Alcohol dehydrogenase-like N-terminal domain-containing protein n=1 Tax=Diaporthe australafricana TaxID=127596 RepID=A0ABR3WYY7_9PEZI
MSTTRALVVTPKERAVAIQETSIPESGPNQILVRVGAVVLNCVDWLYTANPVAAQDSDRRVIGSDFAGEVAKLGKDMFNHTDPRTKVGTRVEGSVQGACSVNERSVVFAQCVVIEWDLAWHVPSMLSLQQAATVNLCGLIAA